MSNPTLAARVDAAIQKVLDEQRVVGLTVLIGRDGEVQYRRSAGFADREARRALKDDDVFRLTSLTKPMVSAAALALIERGRLSLDDQVRRHLPEFAPRTAENAIPGITVRHLLTHTAGLTYPFFQPPQGPYERAGVGDGISDHGISMQEQVRRLSTVPLSYAPGSAWNYSVAIDVLGALLERANGKGLEETVRELVTGPLDMRDTAFAIADLKRLVVPYADDKPPRRMRDPDVVQFGGGSGLHYSPSRNVAGDSFASGGAGMNGTAPEFFRFLETLRQGGAPILMPATVNSMMSNQIGELRTNVEPTPSWGFGYGGAVLMDPSLAGVPQSRGTFKWGGVYGHHWYIDRERKLTVVCLTNTAIEGMAGAFVGELMAAVYA